MENAIIIGALAVILVGALLGVANRLRGKGCCSGGGDYKPKKKRLSTVTSQKTFAVEGMSCEHCKRRVEEAVNDISGVFCRVCLKRGEVTVFYETTIDDSVIINRIEKVGYTARVLR